MAKTISVAHVACLAVVACRLAGTPAKPYEELVPKYNRIKSNAMVRKISKPTLANLDYAAYHANAVILEKERAKPSQTPSAVKLEDITFEGLVSDVKNAIGETPLSPGEQEQPMAWQPLVKKLWEVVKDPALQTLTSKINGYKWADPNVYQPYQHIEAAYLHGTDAGTEVWIRIEFSFWVKFLKAVSDEDCDGFKEIYGRLSLKDMPADSLAKALAWMREEYLAKPLDHQQIVDWITDWASYWYPTKNTDILEMGEYDTWPNNDTEKKVRKTMRGVTVKNPVAVVRGRPSGDVKKPIYNVYVVEGVEREKKHAQEAHAIEGKKLDTSVSENFTQNNARFERELKANGGDWAKWAAKNAAFVDAQKKLLASLPEQQMGFEGKDGWVFFRKSLEYTTAGDLANQPNDKNPLPHLKDLKQLLDKHNINLLFVVVPTKAEVYFESLPVNGAPSDRSAIVNPYGRKILKDMQDQGVEVIDLLPHFLAAKKEDRKGSECVYQKQDTHWTDRGLQIAANLIAERIKAYGWYAEAAKDKVAYTVTDTTFSRQGDIVDKLPEADRPKFPAVTLKAQQVRTPDGELNKGDRNGPVILMGDSFTGVFEAVDCKSAGIGSHIAAKTGLPVDIITSWGGGPLVREKMMRARGKQLDAKRLVVYMMVARDLYNYAQSWAVLQAE